jgi:hypothetical protein
MSSADKIIEQYKGNPNQVVTAEFVQAIKQWVAYDDAIKEANDKLKTYRQKKKELGNSIQIYMKKNHIENHDINITEGGKVRYKSTLRVVPINKEYILKRLTDYFSGNVEKAIQIVEYIYKDREKITSNSLSRIRPRSIKNKP